MRKRVTLLSFALAVASPLALAGSKTNIEVGPGPTTLSEEEKAIAADPASGIEHGVILLEETEQDEDIGTTGEIRYHLRAKILSNEGRDLANVEFPVVVGDSRLLEWWGRTLLPDGSVLELKEEELRKQPLVRSARGGLSAIRAALPGVAPGCVIEYGYVVRTDSLVEIRRVEIQREWPVRRFVYRWKPSRLLNSVWRVSRTLGLDIHASRDKSSILVVGRDLPPVASEPLMPPPSEVRASLTLQYLEHDAATKDFWELEGRRLERRLRSFLGTGDAVGALVASISTDPKAELISRLATAHEWILAHVRNNTLLSFEQSQTESADSTDAKDTAERVLADRSGSSSQINRLYAGIARALGAEANLVMAADRTERYWDPEIRTLDQIDRIVVAVRVPGAPDEQAIFTDPGSGLGFGELPWWVTGATGFLASSDGGRPVFLPPSSADRNVTNVRGTLRYTGDGSKLVAEWTATSKGQAGFGAKRALARLSPRARQDRLDRICGAGSESEIGRADPRGLDAPGASLAVTCALERSAPPISGSISRYSATWLGPWVSSLVPDLPPGRRAQPLVFDFPRVDVLELEVTAPPGFATSDAPPPILLRTPYGKYALSVEPTAAGFRVNRAFALTSLTVPPAEYEAFRGFLADVRRGDETLLAFTRDRGPR